MSDEEDGMDVLSMDDDLVEVGSIPELNQQDQAKPRVLSAKHYQEIKQVSAERVHDYINSLPDERQDGEDIGPNEGGDGDDQIQEIEDVEDEDEDDDSITSIPGDNDVEEENAIPKDQEVSIYHLLVWVE